VGFEWGVGGCGFDECFFLMRSFGLVDMRLGMEKALGWRFRGSKGLEISLAFMFICIALAFGGIALHCRVWHRIHA